MKKSLKIILIIVAVLLLIAGVIVTIFLLNKDKAPYQLDVLSGESVAYTRLRLAAATSAYIGGGELTESDFDVLGKMVKKTGNTWFKNGLGLYVADTMDTSAFEVSVIADENYAATFTMLNDEGDYYLIDYTFEVKDAKGYRIYIVDEYDAD